jgi:diguanylate cyclase (GGDEF)-like protein/PAS domain S-box-containing protein
LGDVWRFDWGRISAMQQALHRSSLVPRGFVVENAYYEGDKAVVVVHEQQLPGDKWVRVEERRTADGGSIGVRVDITDLKRREASFRLLFEENPLPMWVADAKTRQLLAVNAAMCRHYGYARDALLGMSEHQLECQAPDSSSGSDFELHKTASGEVIHVALESRPLAYQGLAAYVCVAFDVTGRNRAQEKISYLACHDALTELPNRTALAAHLQGAVDRAQVTGAGFAVLCIDLDRFKEINDLFGHAIGDGVLREVSRRLQEAARGSYVARVGGDEFIGITDEVPLPASAELMGTRMRAAFELPIEIKGHALKVDLCIGVAIGGRPGGHRARSRPWRTRPRRGHRDRSPDVAPCSRGLRRDARLPARTPEKARGRPIQRREDEFTGRILGIPRKFVVIFASDSIPSPPPAGKWIGPLERETPVWCPVLQLCRAHRMRAGRCGRRTGVSFFTSAAGAAGKAAMASHTCCVGSSGIGSASAISGTWARGRVSRQLREDVLVHRGFHRISGCSHPA